MAHHLQLFLKNILTSLYFFSNLPLFTFNITYLLDWNNRLIRHNDGMLVFVYLFYNTRARNIGAACFFCIGNKISYRYFLFYTDIISDYIDFVVYGCDNLMQLEDDLQKIETLRKIDIFDFDSIKNEYLLEDIKKYGKQIY